MGLMKSSNAFLISERNKKKNCGDCLHCKVSSCSTKKSRLCFCSKDRQKLYDIETYWLTRQVCKKFIDMAC